MLFDFFEDTELYRKQADKALEKYKRENSDFAPFRVDKVKRAIRAVRLLYCLASTGGPGSNAAGVSLAALSLFAALSRPFNLGPFKLSLRPSVLWVWGLWVYVCEH